MPEIWTTRDEVALRRGQKKRGRSGLPARNANGAFASSASAHNALSLKRSFNETPSCIQAQSDCGSSSPPAPSIHPGRGARSRAPLRGDLRVCLDHGGDRSDTCTGSGFSRFRPPHASPR
jgi:hypothetical protein